MSLFKKIKAFFSNKKVTNQEETLRIIGAITVLEIQNNREFRRKIQKTDYGRKLRNVINF